MQPTELDAAIRKSLQLYATKMYPRRLAFEAKQGTAPGYTRGGFQRVVGGAGQAGGWTPPVTPPSPLQPVPNLPPNYPVFPPEYPPQQPPLPNLGGLFSQLLGALFGGQGTGNLLLVAIFGFQIYRAYAKTKGIPLLLDDATAAQLIQLLQQLRQSSPQPPTLRS